MTAATPGDRTLRLVVLGDSTAFTDHRGPQLPGEPTLYPNVAARALETALDRRVEVATIARAGTTVRELWRTLTKDRHVQFEVLAGADAVVVGVGSFDHAPGGVPPAVDAIVPFVRPAAVRRRLRRGLHRAYPVLVRATGGRRPRTPSAEFDRLFDRVLFQVRGLALGAAGVVVGPTSHRSSYYAHRHPGFAAAEARHLTLAARHGFATVAVWRHVRDHLDGLNPDGIHWPPPVHARIGGEVADAVAAQLRGAVPRPPAPTPPT